MILAVNLCSQFTPAMIKVGAVSLKVKETSAKLILISCTFTCVVCESYCGFFFLLCLRLQRKQSEDQYLMNAVMIRGQVRDEKTV